MKRTLTLGALAVANLAVGFLINWFVWYWFSAGPVTDALFAGAAVPNFLLSVVTGSLVNVLVPMFSGEPEDAMRSSATGLALAVVGSFVGLAAVLWLTARFWVPVIIPGFDESTTNLAIRLARVQIWSMPAASVVGVLWARCTVRVHLVRAELAGVVSSAAGLIALAWLLPRWGIDAAAWIFTGRVVFQALLLLPELTPFSRVRFEDVLSAARRTWPLVAGASYYKTDMLVDRALASLTIPGGLSTLHLAQQLYSGVNQIINRAVSAPLLPLLGESAKTADWDRFAHVYRRGVQLAGGVSILALLAILSGTSAMLLRLPMMPELDPRSVQLLLLVLAALSGYLVAGAIGQVTTGALYATGDVKTPPLIGSVGFTAGVLLKLAFTRPFGAPGIALGTTIYYIGNLIALNRVLIRRTLRRTTA